MTIGEYIHHIEPSERRRLRRIVAGGFIVSCLLGSYTFGLQAGRDRPLQHYPIEIWGPHNVPIGSHFKIETHAGISDRCIPQTSRSIVMDPPEGWPVHKRPPEDLLPSDPMSDGVANNIPIPPGDATGCGFIKIKLSTQGCGSLSGIFQPFVGVNTPVRVCVLPAGAAAY